MRLIEFKDGKDLNAEVYTRTGKTIQHFRKYYEYYMGMVEGDTHIWSSDGVHVKFPHLDLMVKIDEPEPEYTYQIELKDFISSEFDTLADLHHYLSREVISKGKLIINKK
jgi:hypothetical protein